MLSHHENFASAGRIVCVPVIFSHMASFLVLIINLVPLLWPLEPITVFFVPWRPDLLPGVVILHVDEILIRQMYGYLPYSLQPYFTNYYIHLKCFINNITEPCVVKYPKNGSPVLVLSY